MNIRTSIMLTAFMLLTLFSYSQDKIYLGQKSGADSIHIDVFLYKIDNLQIIPQEKLLRGSIEIKASTNKRLDSLQLELNENFVILESKFNDLPVEIKRIKNKLILYPDSVPLNKVFKLYFDYYCTESNSELWNYSVEGENFYFSNRNSSLLFPTLGDQGERTNIEINAIIPDDYKIVAFDQASRKSIRNRYRVKSSSRVVLNNFSFNLVKDYSVFSNTFSRVNLYQFTPIDTSIVFKNLLRQIPEQISYLDSVIGSYPFKDFNVLIGGKDERFRLNFFRKGLIIPYVYTQDSILAEKVILSGLCTQWFGNKTSPESKNDMWVTAGLARYIEWMWLERKYGKIMMAKMINAKKVELDKYSGYGNWRDINPHPMYTYDLSVAPLNLDLISHKVIETKDELDILYRTIGIIPDSLSKDVKESFKKRFNSEIDAPFSKKYSYYEIITWARQQKKNTFRISLDAYNTLACLDDGNFVTYDLILGNPGNIDSPEKLSLLKDKSALLIHYLRNYYGDQVFFEFFHKFIDSVSEESVDSEQAIKTIINNGEDDLNEIIEQWIYSDKPIPYFKVKSPEN